MRLVMRTPRFRITWLAEVYRVIVRRDTGFTLERFLLQVDSFWSSCQQVFR